MPHPDLLRAIARMAFEGISGRRLKKRELAAEFRKLGVLPQTGDPDDTRGVQDLVEEAGRWLLVREGWLSVLERDIQDWNLADHLVKAYPCLKEASVIRSRTLEGGPWSPLRKPTPEQEAAEYFKLLCHSAMDKGDDVHAAISGGETLLGVVNYLFPDRRTNVHYYAAALIGRSRNLRTSHIGPETNATIAWLRSGSRPGHLHYGSVSPPDIALPQNIDANARHLEAARILREETRLAFDADYVKASLRDMQEIDTMIASFDILPDLLQSYGVSYDRLKEKGAVGDINYCLFDENGEGRDEWAFFLTPGYPKGVDFMRRLVATDRRVIVVAHLDQLSALRAALKGRLLNNLITDDATARALLE
jgi:DNA-binding transcriptional regulator LsrR (DeoR family)